MHVADEDEKLHGYSCEMAPNVENASSQHLWLITGIEKTYILM